MDVSKNNRKPQGPIRMVREEGHGYVHIYTWIFTKMYADNRDGAHG